MKLFVPVMCPTWDAYKRCIKYAEIDAFSMELNVQ